MQSTFHVSNKDNFENMLIEENLSLLRKEICRHMLKRNESDFYDISEFSRMYVGNINDTHNLINTVIIELNNLGWKTFLGFGGTGLYIYSSEELPLGAY